MSPKNKLQRTGAIETDTTAVARVESVTIMSSTTDADDPAATAATTTRADEASAGASRIDADEAFTTATTTECPTRGECWIDRLVTAYGWPKNPNMIMGGAGDIQFSTSTW